MFVWARLEAIAGRHRCSVRTAIRTDAAITRHQRRVLIDVYESFLRQGLPTGTPLGMARSTVDAHAGRQV
ncbi:hypothetical protein [Nonomuraea jiangxiensis]|uniref:Uncharacterized protein n=1 Tax=Nonomuraea jiangxiensis TaxID=633440 RepID=A0A1G9MQN8_9ACTN|nr:hypothetical protein [Nonomuraea jiangxiensis]SDL76331.1 hypothetical protein SAMN05421869_13082 [Nonomuraea jiangxiensis]